MTVRPTLEFEGGETSLRVRRVSVHERISELFVADVIARSPNEHLDLSGIVGKGAGVAAEAENGVLAWTGICNYMEQIAPARESTGRSTYLLRIVPNLWRLTQRRGHRIFQHMSTPDVILSLLSEWNIDSAVELSDAYKRHEYCVQYGETDFAFFSRLLEEAGISYFFERSKSGEKAKSLLVLTDAPTSGVSMGPINYYEAPNEGQTSDLFVTDVQSSHLVRPGKATLVDYDFRKPNLALLDNSELELSGDEEVELGYERYHFRHGGSLMELDSASDQLDVADDKSIARHDRDTNKALAQRMSEAARYGKKTVGFRSNHPELTPTRLFSIEQHPRSELAGKQLMVLETNVFVSELDWSVIGIATFADAPHRPELRTPRPRVAGIQTAMVVGPPGHRGDTPHPGQEIYTDEFGRVRVHFHWDREGDYDDNATCWLRVSQGWAGTAFGMFQVPRVGQEVIVDFFDGDPDQPLVVGRVFNNTTRVPRNLPDHKTQSIWRSATSPQTDGHFNEIMLEDKAGRELYFFQAQRDLLRLTKNDDTERTGADRTIVVGDARVSAVAVSDMLQVGKQHLVKMVQVNDLKIPAMGDPDVTPLDTWIEMVDQKITLTTGEATVVLEGPNITIDANGGMRFTTDGRLLVQGSMVYFNVMPGQATVHADRHVEDAVGRPDRMIGSVEELFWEPYEEKQKHEDQTVTLTPEPDPSKIPAECPMGPDFYRCRYNDFYRRHPGAPPPHAPSYYLNYGDKYYKRFHAYTTDDLTPEGLAWMDRTGVNLQEAMEAKRLEDPMAYAQLEEDDAAFKRFAYDTHPRSYIDAGLFKLPVQDLQKIRPHPRLLRFSSPRTASSRSGTCPRRWGRATTGTSPRLRQARPTRTPRSSAARRGTGPGKRPAPLGKASSPGFEG